MRTPADHIGRQTGVWRLRRAEQRGADPRQRDFDAPTPRVSVRSGPLPAQIEKTRTAGAMDEAAPEVGRLGLLYVERKVELQDRVGAGSA